MREPTHHDDITYSFSPIVPSNDRRQNERYTTTMRIAKILTDQGGELCLVKNISCGGLRARVYSPIKIGTRAEVELKGGQNIVGEVIWAQDDHIGIEFVRPIDVEEVLSSATSTAAGQRARLPRIEVRRFASVRSGIRVLRGETVDISQGGVKVAVAPPPELGEVIISIIGLYPMRGVARWNDAHHVGIEFNELIPFGHLIAWSKNSSYPSGA